ncbi:AAA family ATPase [Streptomyces sp. NPDC126499]|uniref:ATP-binding protein n=1 Tax=Streptomyces sp. NPDC126499 TaxID=3155314 RepID=UPI00332FFF40
MRAGSEGDGAPFEGRHGGLVGREAELAALERALAARRLVTVVGAAGVGKSHLAMAAADRRDRVVPGAGTVKVRWHDGIPAAPSALAARILRALDSAVEPSVEPSELSGGPSRVEPSGPPGRSSAAEPSGRSSPVEPSGPLSPVEPSAPPPPAGGPLLVLDDVDPVHAECTRLVQSLLMRLPDLRVLVTARRPLGLGDEHVLRLAPLPVGDPAHSANPSPAAELFLARATPGRPDAVAELGAVERVCRLVEGVPLAIELAAAQLGDTTMSELTERLETGLCWLAGAGSPVNRHRSVRASIGAVHALCEPTVRTVWRCLSVFAGAFTEAAAGFVCEGLGVDPDEVPPALAVLAATGVLQPQGEIGTAREVRYRMARAARDFGRERLTASGETAVVRDRHARHCRSVAVVAETLWNSGLQRQAAQLVLDENADLLGLMRRAAHRPALAQAAVDSVLHLWFWWAAHGHAEEGAAHLLRLLPLLPSEGPAKARAQWLAAWLSTAADPTTARRLLDAAWPAAVLAGDDALIGRISHAHGTLAWQRHDLRAAAEHYRHAAATIPEHATAGPPAVVSLAALAIVQTHTDTEAALHTARRALAQPTARDDTWARALAHYARALADHRAGRTGRARHRARRALAHLDPRLDAPQAHRALRRLLDHVEPTGPATGADTAPRLRPPSLPTQRSTAEDPVRR